MPPLEPILTPEEFSTGTGGKVLATDPRLALLLAGASAAVRRYCGWHVTPVLTEELVLDGPGGTHLPLPTLHLTGVAKVERSGNVLVDGVDYEWSQLGAVQALRGTWGDRYRSIRAEITHGYDEDEAADVRAIVQQIVANAAASPMGATREQAGAVAISWATTAPGVSGGISLLARDLAVLDLYRLAKGA